MHLLGVRLLHKKRHLVNLILKYNVIPCPESLQTLLHLFPGYGLIGPSIEKNTVVSLGVALDNGIPCAHGFQLLYQMGIDPRLLQQIK